MTLETRRVKDKEISLPKHMNVLSQDDIDSIAACPDASTLIFSCGVDPRDQSLCMIAGDLDIRLLKPTGKLIPVSAVPSPGGKYIGVTFKDSDQIQAISSAVALKYGESCLGTASLSVNDTYMGDIELDSVTRVETESNENQAEYTEEIHSRGSGPSST